MELDTSLESLSEGTSTGDAHDEFFDVETVGAIDQDDELTIKYVQGLISFDDYMKENELFNGLDEEDDEDDDDNEAIAEAANSASSSVGTSGKSSRKREAKPTRDENRPKRIKRQHAGLNKYLEGLIGEAYMTFFRGERDEAILMCMEVIRQAPRAPKPFITLSWFYEEKAELDKAFQYLLIAAHLAPSDADQWISLAEMAKGNKKLRDAATYYTRGERSTFPQPVLSLAEMAKGNKKFRDAATYYTRAIQGSKDNVSLHEARAELYMDVGDKDKAIKGYEKILVLWEKSGKGEDYFQLSRKIMKLHHENKKIAEAIAVMDRAFEKFPQYVTSEDVNVLVELHFSVELFTRAFEVFLDTCGVTFTVKGEGDQPEVTHEGSEAIEYLRKNVDSAILRVGVPELIAIDLRIKLAITLVRLGRSSLCQELLAPLFEESVDEMGDLYLDVAEAYMFMRECALAKPILASLVASEMYNVAAVWFFYGECLNALGELVNAAEAFKKVVEHSPQHFSARMALSAIQQQMGKPEEALRALTLELGKEGEPLTCQDMRLLLHKSLLLYSQGNLMEFINLSKKILYGRFRTMNQDPCHISLIMNYRSRKHRNFALRQYAERDQPSLEYETAYQEAMSVVPLNDMWELYIKVCETLIEMKMYKDLEELSIMALTVPQFMDEDSKTTEAEFICLIAFVLNKSGSFAFNFIKKHVIKDEGNRAWNLISQIIAMMEDHRHNRFLMRLQLRNPDNLGLGILNGHQSMVSSNFKYALGEYVAAFQQVPHDPMISLCIGLVFINLVSGKLAKRRHILVQQACAFLNQYVELRGECQEAYYNLGRAMQQLGLFHAAVYYYEKGLTLPSAVQGDESRLFDLTKEIAHNLRLIYKNSKSSYMVRMITEKYLVV